MNASVALARASWLKLAVEFATTHTAPARRQLAAHLDGLSADRTDRYFSGLADAVRLTSIVITAAKPHWN